MKRLYFVDVILFLVTCAMLAILAGIAVALTRDVCRRPQPEVTKVLEY